ncbi:hypothetical protein RGU70_07675 [Herbaspirillum sp. RTI4]|uniref:hypothetical protein n=1 Tax=Herbaspirillum sp. RTI4 TaxID=3048640 RepID=UPI002AB4BD48|nr:hypothetical protein [Herbaspirillum sp. RTI4]MDY7578198.1 hypothetical protein [Herbaspirillum sp. RTI4]MEA9981536.1 hypothetical protein [Herbaspirillum sp. RTI4]
MATLEDVVNRQRQGAQFVISAQMLGMTVEEFDLLASNWLEEDGPGFNVLGVPHRTVIDGEFLISRVTVIKAHTQEG